MQLLLWGIQVLILAAGIHLFLRFVRTTRGNRLIRGLFISVLVGVVGLWGLSTLLELEELQHILQGSTGFIVVGCAIVFQSELRRGIAQLGERSVMGGWASGTSRDTRTQVTQAALRLSRSREGALIVFERETPLAPYIETGTAFDAEVQASLLESLFHPGTSLHDGAIILRKDRIAAAGCILPLTDDKDLHRSLGTRHRAGLGLSEESDAVVLIVSEETGAISIAHRGNLNTDIPKDELKSELEALLQGNPAGNQPIQKSLFSALLGALRKDAAWLPGSLLLAAGIWYVAHTEIQETRDFTVNLMGSTEVQRRSPNDGEILVLLAEDKDRLVQPFAEKEFQVKVTGTRRQLDGLGGTVRGRFEVDREAWEGGELGVLDVQWEDPVGGLSYRWAPGNTPELVIERHETRNFTLSTTIVDVDDSRLNPRYQAQKEGLRFEPNPNIKISGPVKRLDEIGKGISLQLKTVTVPPETRDELRERVVLAPNLESRGFSISPSTPTEIVIPILPVMREVDTVTMEIQIKCFDPQRREEEDLWTLPANSNTARYVIETSGLIPLNADPASPAMIERFNTIRRFVEENLKVYVDVAELSPSGDARSVPVRHVWHKDWKQALNSLKLEGGTLGREQLNARLESDAEVLLELRSESGWDPPRISGENP